MRQAQNCQNDIDIHPLRKYIQQILIVMSFIALLLASTSSSAFGRNEGSATSCPAGSTKGILSDTSYSSLIDSLTSGYQTVSSQSTFSDGSTVNIPLKIKMSVVSSGESATSNTPNLYGSTPQAISFIGSASSLSPSTAITLEFQNSLNGSTLFLNKVALSAFDIDKSSEYKNKNFYDYWDDNVKITGITQSGGIAIGALQTISNSKIINEQSELKLPTNTATFDCTSSLQSDCQGSVVFDEPVKSVKLVYTDINNTLTPNKRDFQFRLDSYCYKPTPAYSITKDDGITSIGTSSNTNYIIQITNTGDTSLPNIVLKDPAVNGLAKLTDITCDATDTTNFCSSSTTPPTKAELESTAGFTIPSLPVGRSYTIKIPTRVTASQGSTVTNTATIKASNLDLKSASDSNTVTSIFSGGSPITPATCPSGHKMYYVGNNPPSYTPKETLPIAWTTGRFSKGYDFGNTQLKLSFTDEINLRTGYPTDIDFTDATSGAINMYHDSRRADIDHRMTATINKPVSKYGFVVQDLDANEAGRYTENIAIETIGGIFSSFNTSTHELSNGNRTITGIPWKNCNTSNLCNFNVDWGYKPAQTPFVITHGNPYSEGFTAPTTAAYVVGYSDFYFCLAPPKLVVKKQLNGNRINDADTKRDQFEIKVTGGSVAANSFTTTGTAATVTNDSSGLLNLAEATPYTITETVINGSAKDYNADYTCSNATTGSTFTTTTGATALNISSTTSTRSFTLSNLNYGDEITCTITNTPKSYTFSGTVFNDNGGITGNDANATNANITTGPYASNDNYFNGIFDTSQETGITGSTVKLVNCATPNTVYATQAVSATGTYQINASTTTINSNLNNICLVEDRSGSDYPIRTSSASKTLNIVSNTFDYPNNNFGRVIAENVALVLKKYQYINDCPTTLNYTAISETATPSTGFSTASIENIEPGKCIAYKIAATNRANTQIDSFIMRDILQKEGVNGATVTSVLANPALSTVDYTATENPAIGTNGEIKTKMLSLAARVKRDFYFNTKYGTTVNAQ